MASNILQSNCTQKRMAKFCRSAIQTSFSENDKQFAKQQVKRIYSQELSKLLQRNKYFLTNSQNQLNIQHTLEHHNHHKFSKLKIMLERSSERKQKLLNDRVRLYEMNNKSWLQKKDLIKQKISQDEKNKSAVAKDYRLRTENYWKQRQSRKQNQLHLYSSKYHCLFNSNIKNCSMTSNSNEKQQSIVSPRQKKQQRSSSTSFRKYLNHHQQKQRNISCKKDQQKIENLIKKLSKIESVENAKNHLKKQQILQRNKLKLNQVAYRNNKPQIGQSCPRYHNKQKKFQISKTPSPMRLTQEDTKHANRFLREQPRSQLMIEKYDQKIRHLKMAKILKIKIREELLTEFHRKRFRLTTS